MEYHLQLGVKLDALCARDILILSGGNVVHNLRRIQRRRVSVSIGRVQWASLASSLVCCSPRHCRQKAAQSSSETFAKEAGEYRFLPLLLA